MDQREHIPAEDVKPETGPQFVPHLFFRLKPKDAWAKEESATWLSLWERLARFGAASEREFLHVLGRSESPIGFSLVLGGLHQHEISVDAGMLQVRPRARETALSLEEPDIRESRRITEQRELLRTKQRVEFLEAQAEGQLRCITALSRTSADLTHALVGSRDAKVRISDKRSGRVIRVDGIHVVVAYDTPGGRVEHVYDQTQFEDGKLPDEGDGVEAHAFVVFRPGTMRTADTTVSESEEGGEFKSFRKKRHRGPVIFREPAD
ncbi:MAG: hypothetical protein V2A79_04655 [Planctomycetota bacterium]